MYVPCMCLSIYPHMHPNDADSFTCLCILQPGLDKALLQLTSMYCTGTQNKTRFALVSLLIVPTDRQLQERKEKSAPLGILYREA